MVPKGAPTVQRVRCRRIVENDLGALAALYTEGFPDTTRAFWELGLARMAALPRIDGMPRFGYALESGGALVGALLTIYSRRGEQIIANPSAWYVQPAYRDHAIMLFWAATKFKHVLYVNTSPIWHIHRTLRRNGWQTYNSGRSLVFAALKRGGGRIRRAIPDDLPAHERVILEDHHVWGGICVICDKDGVASPFIFKPRRLTRLKLPVMELIYCRGTAEFERCAGALGRHFLARGQMGILLDGTVKNMPSRYFPGREIRFYKGPRAPMLNDFAYTEKLIFP